MIAAFMAAATSLEVSLRHSRYMMRSVLTHVWQGPACCTVDELSDASGVPDTPVKPTQNVKPKVKIAAKPNIQAQKSDAVKSAVKKKPAAKASPATLLAPSCST